ncbi:hypothetical protein [Treponema sp.]|uniref:hypothetical protein n=1 Tax=Treponema sp. TaxID=166 RepID=UPI00298D84AB|nr:hypothetical protein [Treponema sp.]MCQ2240657.1 hypothetical protein [Treponema sp.]
MKIEAKFYSEKNELFFLDGSKAELNSDKIKAYGVKWTQVGLDEDSYNEEFLANLRDQLKAMEDEGTYGFVVPECDSSCDDEAKKEAFVASMKHCARRIKDCENIIGFSIPEEVDFTFFMEELSAKHKHYIYFTKNSQLANSNDKIVQY